MAEETTLEMDEILEKILFYALDEAKQKIEAGEEMPPFTVIVEGDNMFVENYPEETDPDACRANAKANVKSASSFASHYVFCFDGFLDTDQGQIDAVIVECASNDMENAYVIGLLYHYHDEEVHFEAQPAYIDDTETFFDRAAVEAAKAAAEEEADADELLARTLGANADEDAE